MLLTYMYVIQEKSKWADGNGRHQNKVYRLPELFSPTGHARLASLADFLFVLRSNLEPLRSVRRLSLIFAS